MKDIILNRLHQMFTKDFELKFPPFIQRKDFEKQYPAIINDFKILINKLKVEYYDILGSKEDIRYIYLIKVSKEDFVKNNGKYFSYLKDEGVDKGDLFDKIVRTRFDDEKVKSLINSEHEFNSYKQAERWVREYWILSIEEFIANKLKSDTDSIPNRAIMYYLWINIYWDERKVLLEKGEIANEKVQEIYDYYLESQGDYMDLFETCEKYIQRENILPFSVWVLNIGNRDYSNSRYKIVSTYSVFNKGKKYLYSHSSDAKAIKGIFVNLFILSNNELLKLCIGSSSLLQRTPYLISKDIQRVDITGGNVLELHMHKHFDPETIIFDTEDEAYKFQRKITELRELRRNPNTRK